MLGFFFKLLTPQQNSAVCQFRGLLHRRSGGGTGGDSPQESKIVRAKCHKTRFWALSTSNDTFAVGAQSEPRWGSLQSSPDPLAGGKGARCPLKPRRTLPPFSAFSLAPPPR